MKVPSNRRQYLLKIYRSDIGIGETTYMQRWVCSTPWGGLRIHRILRSDAAEHPHDHPMDFLSLVLWRGYTEYLRCDGPDGPYTLRTRRRMGSILHRRAEDIHRVEIEDGPSWTLVLTGPMRREWGFMTHKGWVDWETYEKIYPSSAMDENQRLKEQAKS